MARRVFLFFLFVLATFFGTLAVTDRLRTAGSTPPATPPTGAAAPAIQSRVPGAATLPDLTTVAERSIGSVTNISSKQIVRTSASPFANDPIFRHFFGGQDDVFGYRDRLSQSLGSGVVVSSDGYVLTNNHVVGDMRAEVSVTLADKRELRAKIIGVDETTDLAVLKINAANLPTMPWGDSSKLKVAEWVLAIGNPFSLSQSVTLGIVSATGRTLEGQLASYEDFIQTDAAINPGNSGGALISARGELVGINTAIFTETGGYMGIGFAVPSNLARHVMEELIQYGEVQRGTIAGILSLQPMTTEHADRLGAPNARGLLVARMEQDSDAYNAGIRPGDIIVSYNSAPVDDFSHFMRLLADTKIGSTATLGVLREGKSITIKVPIVKASTRGRRR